MRSEIEDRTIYFRVHVWAFINCYIRFESIRS